MHYISIWKDNVEGILNMRLDAILNAKGFIGVIFTSAIGRFFFVLFAVVMIFLAVIGLITVIGWIIKRKRKKRK